MFLAKIANKNKILSFIILIAIFTVIAFIIYAPSLNGDFVFDDKIFIENNHRIQHPQYRPQLFKRFEYRKRIVVFLTFLANFLIHGNNTFGYHVVNVLIHVMTVLGVYWLVKILMSLLSPPRNISESQNQNLWIPVLASFLFLVHPLQTQAVSYISQRFTSMAAMFYVYSVICYFQIRRGKGWVFYVGIIVCGVLAIFSKESAYTLPIMIFFLDGALFTKKEKRVIFILWSILGVLCAGWLVYRFSWGRYFNPDTLKFMSRMGTQTSRVDYLITQFSIIGRYLSLWVFPLGQNVDPDLPLIKSLWNSEVLKGLFAIIFMGILAICSRKRYFLLTFGIFWYFFTISISSSIFPIKHLMMEHRTYLPNVGLCIITAVGLAALVRKFRYGKYVVIVFLSVLCVLTFSRNHVWKNDVAVWHNAWVRSPLSVDIERALGEAYMQEKDYNSAVFHLEHVFQNHPGIVNSAHNLAICYRNLGKDEEMIRILEYLVERRSKHRGRRSAYSKVIFASELEMLAKVYWKRQEWDLAQARYKQVLQFSPDHYEAYMRLGRIAQQKNNIGEAINYFKEVLRVQPENYKVCNQVGVLYMQQERYGQAKAHFVKALKMNKNYDLAYHNLGVLFLRQGKLAEAQMQLWALKADGHIKYYRSLKEKINNGSGQNNE